MKRRLIVLVLLSPLLVADTCGSDDNPCLKPYPELGAVVTTAEAASDPCAGQGTDRVLAWYLQGGTRYPLRCGKRDPKGWGYLHIRDDQAPELEGVPHGDPMNDATFSDAITVTLSKGTEAAQGGGNWRYTVRYSSIKESCTGHWGFRVILAKSPPRNDGHPLGIVTAFYLRGQPQFYP